MRYTFDLCNSVQKPSDGFKQWVPGWWYRVNGLAVRTGISIQGSEWLLIGDFLEKRNTQSIIDEFIKERDTEILFNADGQFVLFIHDNINQQVNIYRDRSGIIPFVIGTGIKGLTCSPWPSNVIRYSDIDPHPSKKLLTQIPLYRIVLPNDSTIHEIKQISGNYLVRISDRKFLFKKNILKRELQRPFKNLQDAADCLGNLLSKGIRKRIKEIDRIGIWLSGGNDSSLIVALAREYLTGYIKTIFVTFEGYDRSYGQDAKLVAQRFQTDHDEICINLVEYLNNWARTIKIIEEPVNSPSTIGQVIALDNIQPSVDAMLIGEGADTIFGGPYWASMLLLSKIACYLPNSLRNIFSNLASKIQSEMFIPKAVSKTLKALGSPLREYVQSEIFFGSKKQIEDVFGAGIWQKNIHDFEQYLNSENMLEEMIKFLLLDWLTVWNGSLKKIGLYFQYPYILPFMDYELMKNSFRLPLRLRYHLSMKKAALKIFARRYFDKKFIHKPKEGFGVPLKKWFSTKQAEPFLNLPFEGRSLSRGWWNEKELKKIIDMHRNGQGTDSTAESVPWIAINLELWARICLEGDHPDLYRIN